MKSVIYYFVLLNTQIKMSGQVTRKGVLNHGYWRIVSKEELERVEKWVEKRDQEAEEYFKKKYGGIGNEEKDSNKA